MLKHVLAATTALAALASSALAADLPRRAAPPAYAAVPVFTWTGFYIGANAGYVSNEGSRITTTGNNPGTAFNTTNNIRVNSVSLDADGFTGGGQIGYNYQFGGIVVGLEADAAYTDLRRTAAFTGSPNAAGNLATSVFTTDIGFIGTVRGRLGYAFDRLLVFGTGGLAYGDVRSSALFYQPQPGGGTAVLGFAGGRSNIETGWTAGGGVEYALPSNYNFFGSSAVTVKAEALYYDLGRQSYSAAGVLQPVVGAAVVPGTVGTSYTVQHETSGVIARAGINFKFGTF